LNAETMAPIPIAEGAQVLTPESVMDEGVRPAGERVVVFDADGYFMGGSIAEQLAEDGVCVTCVTPFSLLGPYTEFTLEDQGINRELRAKGVTVVTDQLVERIAPGQVELRRNYDDVASVLEADSVVLVTARQQNDGLYSELKTLGDDALRREGIDGVYRIGDC